jgi:hypothetical protein
MRTASNYEGMFFSRIHYTDEETIQVFRAPRRSQIKLKLCFGASQNKRGTFSTQTLRELTRKEL